MKDADREIEAIRRRNATWLQRQAELGELASQSTARQPALDRATLLQRIDYLEQMLTRQLTSSRCSKGGKHDHAKT